MTENFRIVKIILIQQDGAKLIGVIPTDENANFNEKFFQLVHMKSENIGYKTFDISTLRLKCKEEEVTFLHSSHDGDYIKFSKACMEALTINGEDASEQKIRIKSPLRIISCENRERNTDEWVICNCKMEIQYHCEIEVYSVDDDEDEDYVD